jgi:hypothetical protein
MPLQKLLVTCVPLKSSLAPCAIHLKFFDLYVIPSQLHPLFSVKSRDTWARPVKKSGIPLSSSSPLLQTRGQRGAQGRVLKLFATHRQGGPPPSTAAATTSRAWCRTTWRCPPVTYLGGASSASSTPRHELGGEARGGWGRWSQVYKSHSCPSRWRRQRPKANTVQPGGVQQGASAVVGDNNDVELVCFACSFRSFTAIDAIDADISL